MVRKSYFSLVLLAAFLIVLTASFTAFAQGIGTSSITLSSTSVTVSQGGTSTSISYTVNLASGSTWGTQLAVSNAQTLRSEGIVVNGLPSSMQDPPFSGSFTISVSSSATPGSYPVVLVATGDDPSSTSVTLTVNVVATVAPTLAISLVPNLGSVVQGGSVSTTVNVNISSGTATLSASGLPSGATVTFSPSTLSASGSSTMTISTSSTTPLGSYTIIITASSPQGVSKLASYTLTVTSTPSIPPAVQKQSSPVYEYVAIIIAVIIIAAVAYFAASRRGARVQQV